MKKKEERDWLVWVGTAGSLVSSTSVLVVENRYVAAVKTPSRE